MKFRTEYKAEKAPFTLTPEHPVVMLGSCFADNIRTRMRECLWKAENPLGTLYNPLSIEKALRAALSGDFGSSLFKDSNGIYHSWLFDSKISSRNVEDCSDKFRTANEVLIDSLKSAQALFVTFGTSYCYFLSENPDYVVANCHKQPSAVFARRRLSVGEIAECWQLLATDLRKNYPGLKIVFTVSPVRHVKDGFVENKLSKATLLLAADQLCHSVEECYYFPAYEIVNDDLRDYRYYAADLVHPSDQAVEYLWEIFRATYIDEAGEKILKEGESITRAYSHRSLIETPEKREARLALISARHSSFKRLHPNML